MRRTGARIDPSAAGPVDAVVPVAAIPRTPRGAIDGAALAATPILDLALEARASAALPEGVVTVRDVERTLPHIHPTQLVRLPRLHTSGQRGVQTDAGTSEPSGPPALADGGPPPGGPATLAEVLRVAAASAATTTYLDRDGATTVPHAELLAAAERVAGGLRARGVRPGDAVLIAMSEAQEILTAFWGAVLIGAIPAIVSVPRSLQEQTSALDVLVSAFALLDRPLVIADAAIGGVLGAPVTPFAELSASARDTAHHAAQPDDVAIYNLTSGSTGQPKCIELTHRGLLARARGTQAAMRFSASDRTLSWLPFDHIGSISDWHIRPLDGGATLFYAPKELILAAPLVWLDLLSAHHITASWAPNFAFQLVLSEQGRAGQQRAWDLSRVDCLLTAGESVSRQTVADFAAALAAFGLAPHTVVPAFGMAELGSGVTYARPMRGQLAAFHELDGASFADLGPPIPGAKLRVVDGEGRVLRERVVGQVQIGGAVVARGYRKASPAQAAAFLPDGWLDTGDRGFLADGRLVLTGRSKDVIIVNGSNYYAHEIESVVEGEAGVEPSFVAAFAVHVPQERLAILYSSSLPPSEHARQVRAIRRAVVARVGINPELVVPVDRARIPKTAIGKIMRTRLRDAWAQGGLDAEIAEIEAAIGGPAAIPDWFAQPVWAAATRTEDDPSAGPLVLVTGGLDTARDLAAAVARSIEARGRRARVVASLDEVAADREPVVVVSCAALGGAGVHELVTSGLAALPAEHTVVVLTPDTARDPRAAAAAGWARALIAERGARRIEVTASVEPDDLAAELLARGDPEVRLGDGARAVPRLRPLEWPASPLDPPIQAGRLYLITGGSGGLGQVLARELGERWGAHTLRVARHPEATASTSSVALDVSDAAALEAAVAAAERAHGPLAGVFHLAGVYREGMAREETTATLDPVLAPKVAGTEAIVRLLGTRPDAFFVAYSSLASFMGGAGLGAYGAANAYLDATATRLRAAGRRAWSIAWSAFSEVGLGREAAASELLRARGYLGITPQRGLASLWAAMTRDEPVIAVGLDRTHVELRARVQGTPLATRELRAFTAAARDGPLVVQDRLGHDVAISVRVVDPLPRTADGAIDVDALLGQEHAPRTPPTSDTERTLAALWCDLLAVPDVAREDDFFGLGGHSLLATQLASRVRDGLGVTIPVGKLFEATTLAAMSTVIDQLREVDGSDVASLLDQVRHLSPDQLAALLADDAVSGAVIDATGDLADGPQRLVPITTVGIITANRPVALERAAESYLENLREHGRRADVVVTDDSRDESTARENAERLRVLSRKYDLPIYYGWVDAKLRYIDALVARTGASRPVVQAGLVRGASGIYACGVNRNSFQMAVVGEAAFLADDDTLCRITPAPTLREGVGIGAGQDAAEMWFYSDREAALRGQPIVRADLLGLHEAYLGRTAAELSPDTTFRHPIDANVVARLTAPTSRVGVTLSGLLGDVGWAVPFGQWGSPMGYLLLDDASRARLVASEETYQGAYASRQVLRVTDRPTLTDPTYSMSTFWAFDNRSVLPPHLVSMRGADLIFGMSLWRTHPGFVFAHLPHALFHAPLERREFRAAEMIRSATGFDATRMFINLLRNAPEPSSPEPAERMRAIGRWMLELGGLPPADFWRLIAEQGRQAEEQFLGLIDAQLQRHHGAPRWWAEDLSRYAETLRRSIARESWFHPLDVRATVADDDAADRLAQRMVTELGEMMLCWPDLQSAALELRREGVRMVERLT